MLTYQTAEQTLELPVIWDAMMLIVTSLQWGASTDTQFQKSPFGKLRSKIVPNEQFLKKFLGSHMHK